MKQVYENSGYVVLLNTKNRLVVCKPVRYGLEGVASYENTETGLACAMDDCDCMAACAAA